MKLDPILSRRRLVRAATLCLTAPLLSPARRAFAGAPAGIEPLDAERMRALAEWTLALKASPYSAEIFDTHSGVSLMRANNAVHAEHDPSAHGEVRTIRLACQKLASASLKGYTLYTTCEPCPMCMGCCLWAGLDRVVYGATIADAARFGHQILVPAAELERRSDMPCTVDGPVERERCLQLFPRD